MKELVLNSIEKIDADIYIPGSKSITNRALIIAALADGKCHFKNALFSDDTRHMVDALRAMGYEINTDEDKGEMEIFGKGNNFSESPKPLFLGNAGTAMRFLTTFVNLGKGKFELTGNERMQERPIGDLIDGLLQLGAKIEYKKNKGFPPLLIESSGLSGGNCSMKGNISSQYFSSLMLSAPYAKSDIEIKVIGDLVSKPYIDITQKLMEDFGVSMSNNNYQSFHIPSGQTYKAQDYIIEGDASNASYFFAAAAVTKGRVKVHNIDFSTQQGDIDFARILEKMGCTIKESKNAIEVIGSDLKGIDVDMNHCSDVVQTLSVVALFAQGRTTIRNVYNMRVKETDRLKALNNELTKLGAKIEEKEDGIIIDPAPNYKPAKIETYDDHRMAMSFSVAGLKIDGLIILDPGCTAKTFPKYFELYNKMIGKK